MSRELILSMSVSIDGFVAGSNGEIDWVFRNRSEESTRWLVERLAQAGLIAMGRKSYESMADYWPTSATPFARPMNRIPKAVFSRSGTIPHPSMAMTLAAPTIDPTVLEGWRNPTVAGADLAADIRCLKAEDGGPIVVLGGASFASSLIAANLIDVFRLVVHPVALRRGLPIFAELEAPLHLELEEFERFATGAVVKTYRPSRAQG